MSTCPVCAETIDADQVAFTFHVNSHFDQAEVETSGQRQHARSSHSNLSDVNSSGVEKQPVQLEESEPTFNTCPICDFPLSFITPTEAEQHINTCLVGPHSGSNYSSERPVSPSSAAKRARTPSFVDDELDQEYDYDFPVNGPSVLQRHVNEGADDKGWDDGPARPGGWMDWAGRKVERGDQWWDPISGVIPILEQTLRTAAHQGITRRAVLCRDVLHIKGIWKFDMGWGCGYRNAQMCLASLLPIPVYASLFERETNGADPGVRRIQGWIQEAWGEGYDPEGCRQLKGKVLGSRKWIGPADLYAMFSYKGIPCELYDFPKPANTKDASKTAHIALQQWVKAYFLGVFDREPQTNEGTPQIAANVDGQPKSAFDVLMRSSDHGTGRGEVVRTSKKFPLVLQHSGHSRTIVGYEENARGDINLLLFDPGRSMPKDIRAAAMVHTSQHPRRTSTASVASAQGEHRPSAESSKRPSYPLILTKRSSRSLADTHESLPFSPPFTNGRAEVIYSSVDEMAHDPLHSAVEPDPTRHDLPGTFDMSQARHVRGGSRADAEGEGTLEEDEEVSSTGWVRKKLPRLSGNSGSGKSKSNAAALDTVKTLNNFRVNLGTLSRHTEYQILCFTGGEVMSPAQRAERKVVASTVVRL